MVPTFIRSVQNKLMAARQILPGFYWRPWAKHIGRNVRFHGHVILDGPEQISIGDDTSLNEGVLISARGPITLGRGVRVSARAMIISGALNYEALEQEAPHCEEPIVVEDGVWIGAGAIVLQGVRIGRCSVVGAGAVVTSDVPANVLVAGVPARVIRHLDRRSESTTLHKFEHSDRVGTSETVPQ